ncbi:MAG: Rid family hydrolase [Alphaproteobacteria bacterium]|nr:Rid family hydrolase [Alphaproteobacteria bacterium]
MDDVVKAQIFLTDINDFASVSPIRGRYFAKARPVSTMMQVSAFARQGATIEIEVTAVKSLG